MRWNNNINELLIIIIVLICLRRVDRRRRSSRPFIAQSIAKAEKRTREAVAILRYIFIHLACSGICFIIIVSQMCCDFAWQLKIMWNRPLISSTAACRPTAWLSSRTTYHRVPIMSAKKCVRKMCRKLPSETEWKQWGEWHQSSVKFVHFIIQFWGRVPLI